MSAAVAEVLILPELDQKLDKLSEELAIPREELVSLAASSGFGGGVRWIEEQYAPGRLAEMAKEAQRQEDQRAGQSLPKTRRRR